MCSPGVLCRSHDHFLYMNAGRSGYLCCFGAHLPWLTTQIAALLGFSCEDATWPFKSISNMNQTLNVHLSTSALRIRCSHSAFSLLFNVAVCPTPSALNLFDPPAGAINFGYTFTWFKGLNPPPPLVSTSSCSHFHYPRCEATPATTLKRPSPGDGFENHMYFIELWITWNVTFMSKDIHIVLSHCALLMLASWLLVELAFSRVQPAALATHALKDIPLAPLVFASFALHSRESSAFSIHLCMWFIVTERVQVLRNTFLNSQYWIQPFVTPHMTPPSLMSLKFVYELI